MPKNKSNRILLVLVIFLSFLRIALYTKIPLSAYGNQMHDDQLLFDYARQLLSGNWLGDYSNLTLVKGISFPIFIVLCQYLFIPYTIGLGLLNIGSALVFINAVKIRISNFKILCLMYVLIIFSPVGFSSLITQRAYRMAIIPGTVILVFGCFIGLFLRRNLSLSRMLPWAIGSGISLTFFWFIREDSIWILPFAATVSLLMIIYLIIFERKKKKVLIQKLSFILLPLILLLAGNLLICQMNYTKYGIFTANDRSGTQFGEMMSQLYQIEDTESPDYIWVSNQTLENVMEVCPTLASIEPFITQSITNWGEGVYQDIRGDLIAWVLRDAVQNAGYYEDAQTANDFYKQVNSEIISAKENGDLKEDTLLHFTSQSTGISFSDIPAYIKKTLRGMYHIAGYDITYLSDNNNGTGGISAIRNIEALTGSLAKYPNCQYSLQGWLFVRSDQDTLTAELVDENNNYLTEIVFFDSPDVYEAFPESANAGRCRFKATLYDLPENTTVYMNIYINDVLVHTFQPDCVTANDFQGWMQASRYSDNIYDYSERALDLSNGISKLYQKLSPIVNILAVIGYLLLSIYILFHLKEFKKPGHLPDLWLMTTGMLLSSFVLTFGVMFFCSWFPENQQIYINFYNAGSYPLIQMSKYLAIYCGASVIYKFHLHRTSA